MLERSFNWDPTPKALAAGVADQISTNIFDAGAAKKLFEGQSEHPLKLMFHYLISAGTGAMSFRCRLVGADNDALTTNPVIIADSGVITLDDGGSALAIGDVVSRVLALNGQTVAKRYYGLFYTQGTADQDGDVTVQISEAVQSNMLYRKAAVPA